MNSFQRPLTLAEIATRTLAGSSPGYEIKDFLHAFAAMRSFDMLKDAPGRLEGKIPDGKRWDAFFQALAEYLAAQLEKTPPDWTFPPIQLENPWFVASGDAVRNYLLLSSPTSFRARNLFIDEDGLTVA